METPAALIFLHAYEHLVGEHRRQSGGGLVEQQDRWFHHQRPAHRDHLPLAAGQRAGLALAPLASSGNSEHTASNLSREGLRPQVDTHLQVLLDGQRGEHVVVLRHVADALGDQRVRLGGGDVLASRSVTVPARTGISPNIALSSVDLPAPLGPMMPTISPLAEVEIAPLQDVHPGQVAGHQVVGPQQRASGQLAVPLRGRGQLRVGQPIAGRAIGRGGHADRS